MNTFVTVDERQARGSLRVPAPISLLNAPTSPAILFEARDDADFMVEGLTAINISGSAKHVTIYMTDGTAAAANSIFHEFEILAHEYETFATVERPILVPPGFTLYAAASVASSVNVYGHGFHYQGVYG